MISLGTSRAKQRQLLVKDPAQRATLDQVSKHSFFTGKAPLEKEVLDSKNLLKKPESKAPVPGTQTPVSQGNADSIGAKSPVLKVKRSVPKSPGPKTPQKPKRREPRSTARAKANVYRKEASVDPLDLGLDQPVTPVSEGKLKYEYVKYFFDFQKVGLRRNSEWGTCSTTAAWASSSKTARTCC